jgi:lipoate-protein ligase A
VGRPGPPGRAWRLLVTEPLSGAANMAVDEALLRARIAGGPPTVRFYAWVAPTVSLGYGQTLAAVVDEAACRDAGVDLVRRPTGGGALLHESPTSEVTYSVVAHRDDFEGAGDLLDSYRVLATGLAEGLDRLGLPVEVAPPVRERRPDGPAFCFARTGAYEITVSGRKLVGSAQRRQAGAFLQQGSLLLHADLARVARLFPAADPGACLATLGAALGQEVPAARVVAALARGLGSALGVRLTPGWRRRSTGRRPG